MINEIKTTISKKEIMAYFFLYIFVIEKQGDPLNVFRLEPLPGNGKDRQHQTSNQASGDTKNNIPALFFLECKSSQAEYHFGV